MGGRRSRWGRVVALAVVALGPAAAVGFVDLPPKVYTRPDPPDRASLDRLNLALGWAVYLPVEGGRDGVILVQPVGDQVFVQLRSGLLVALDAASGRAQWRRRVGLPYPLLYPVAANDRMVLVVSGARLYGLSRRTGASEFEQEMPTAPSGPVVADAERAYVTLGANRLAAYVLPRAGDALPTEPRPVLPPGLAEATARRTGPAVPTDDPSRPIGPAPDRLTELRSAASVTGSRQVTPSIAVVQSVIPPYRLDAGDRTPSIAVTASSIPPYRLDTGARTPSVAVLRSVTQLARLSERNPPPELKLAWEYQPGARLDEPPVVSGDFLIQTTAGRQVFATLASRRQVTFDFLAVAPVSGPAGQYGETAYIPTADDSLYALDIPLGKALWRVTSPGVVRRRPLATEKDLYLATDQAGLARLDRATGDPVWTAPRAARLLSAGPRFVYGTDAAGDLLVIDQRRGLVLGTLETRDFVVPVSNYADDRVYLAAHNGLLVSLHDRSLPRPQPTRPAPAAPADDTPKKEPAVPGTKKDEEKKDS